MSKVLRRLVYPKWEQLRNGDGPHLIFGIFPGNSSEWQVVDILPSDGVQVVDLLADNWPWTDVAAIHSVGMLTSWPPWVVPGFLKRCYDVLRPDGLLWLGEPVRGVNPEFEWLSGYTTDSLRALATDAGFIVHDVKEQHTVTGRINDGTHPVVFAFKCVRPKIIKETEADGLRSAI
ncbi:MAG: class I SAM-dependent methyltransferase [Planctomycetota bacterium]|jgi:hypothetical protein